MTAHNVVALPSCVSGQVMKHDRFRLQRSARHVKRTCRTTRPTFLRSLNDAFFRAGHAPSWQLVVL
jgi:hypothetical protein